MLAQWEVSMDNGDLPALVGIHDGCESATTVVNGSEAMVGSSYF